MEELKTDGSSYGSGGINAGGYQKFVFNKELIDFKSLGDFDKFTNPSTYTIDGKKVTEQAFNDLKKEQDAKPNAVWYDYTQENLKAHQLA